MYGLIVALMNPEEPLVMPHSWVMVARAGCSWLLADKETRPTTKHLLPRFAFALRLNEIEGVAESGD